MDGKLAKTTPPSIYKTEHIQLMDAGMSNNLPIYPLLRPGREVEIIIAFDASADVKKDNWLSVTEGYARQRGIRGWPLGIGWPRPGETPREIGEDIEKAQAQSTSEAKQKLDEARSDQAARRSRNGEDVKGKHDEDPSKFQPGQEGDGDLGYCSVWVGTMQERNSSPPPPSKLIDDSNTWQLMEPDAGIAVVYLPLLTNPKVPGVNPGETDYLSTWNFVYTPEQIDQVAALAKANYDEGKDKIKACVRGVYERKKKLREGKMAKEREERYRGLVRKGMAHRLGEGDQFS
jgi:phospholipase A2